MSIPEARKNWSPAGRLRDRIGLEIPNATQVGGQPIPNWTPTASFWGDVLAVGGGEGLRGRMVEATVTHQVIARYRSDLAGVDSTQRLVGPGEQILNINRVVDPDGRGRWLVFDCVEVV